MQMASGRGAAGQWTGEESVGAMKRQLFWFVVVGSLAALTHLVVVMALVETTGMAPLWANVGGWMVAFTVSFAGHHRLTFSGSASPFWPALRRFWLISLGAFLVNQAAYAVLLRWSGWNYALLLALVLVGVAVGTFVLSRWWAFAHTKPSVPPLA
jgi:putative flippase GtrA